MNEAKFTLEYVNKHNLMWFWKQYQSILIFSAYSCMIYPIAPLSPSVIQVKNRFKKKELLQKKKKVFLNDITTWAGNIAECINII